MTRIGINSRPLVVSLVLLLLTFLACKQKVNDELNPPNGSVAGTVMFRPGYDAMPPKVVEPPPLRPQGGIRVYLLRVPGDAPPLLGQESILAETETDSLGQYRIEYLPGEYYLAVYEPSTGSVLTGLSNGIKLDDLEISEMVPIIIKPNEQLMQDFELHGLVTM